MTPKQAIDWLRDAARESGRDFKMRDECVATLHNAIEAYTKPFDVKGECAKCGKLWNYHLLSRIGRLTNRVCRECHIERLRGDFKRVLEAQSKRKEGQ